MPSVRRFGRVAAAVVLASGLFSGVPGAVASTEARTFIVLYNESAVPADVATSLARAGGRLIASYDEIGVAIASSSAPTFQSTMRQDSRVAEAAQSARGVVRLKDRIEQANDGPAQTRVINQPATDSDNLS